LSAKASPISLRLIARPCSRRVVSAIVCLTALGSIFLTHQPFCRLATASRSGGFSLATASGKVHAEDLSNQHHSGEQIS
jgi:hypothetical protein